MFSNAIVAGISAVALVTTLSSSAFAETVRLRSNDGTVDVLGEYVSYEGAQYLIDTSLGPILFDAEEYWCLGTACPTDAVHPIDYSVSRRQTAPVNLFVRVN